MVNCQVNVDVVPIDDLPVAYLSIHSKVNEFQTSQNDIDLFCNRRSMHSACRVSIIDLAPKPQDQSTRFRISE